MLSKFRITRDLLLRTDNSNADLSEFMYYQNQYDTKDISNSNHFTVWDYNRKLNKVFNSPPLIDESITELVSKEYIDCEILLRQNFSWSNIFGIHVIIKSYGTGQTFYSKLLTIGNWSNSEEFELIDGDFWSERVQFKIPKDEQLTIACKLIEPDDILFEGVDIGMIIDYVSQNDYEPLVSEKPLPSEITTEIVVNPQTHYITVTTKTTNNSKTVRQTLIDYFGLTGKVVPITVKHVITYGIEDNYKSIGLSNEINNFLPVTIGLDLSQYLGNIINIYVSTIYTIDGKILTRDQQIVFDLNDVLNPIISDIIDFEESPLFPISIIEETVINQNVIQTNTERKIVPIIKPIFIKVESTDVVYESKNISFNDITVNSYMNVYEIDNNGNMTQNIIGTILSEVTSEGIIYFGLHKLSGLAKTSYYQIYSYDENVLLKTGNITVPET